MRLKGKEARAAGVHQNARRFGINTHHPAKFGQACAARVAADTGRKFARMDTASAQGRQKRLTPGIAVAAAAGGVSLLVSCLALILWRLQPALLLPFLLLSPVIIAVCAWLAARHAFRMALKPAVAMAGRLAANDFSAYPTPAAGGEALELIEALERGRNSLAAREKTARVHAAVARLMGAGIGRLARGDLTARIDVDLPSPYDAFGRDFNAATETLGAAARERESLRAGMQDQATALAEAAIRLGKRAEKLAARVEADLRIIEVLSRRDAEEALDIARHTMEGVGVAARRNIEAAREFSRLAEALRDGPALPQAARSIDDWTAIGPETDKEIAA